MTPSAEEYRVLVVDDEPADLEYFVRVLRRNGFSVEQAAYAEEAMEIMGREPIAVLVTDLWMPGINGDELGRWAKEKFPDLEVIIITADGSVHTASEAVRFGASDYLSKPLESSKVIVESITRAMDKLRERTRSSDELKQLQALSDSMSEILNRLPQGVILVTGDCRVVQVNLVASQILQSKDGLQVDQGGQLVARSAADTRSLRELVLKASTASGGSPTGGAMTILRPEAGTSLSLMVTPVDPTMNTSHLEEVVSVFVVDPERPTPGVGMLCKLYGMTPAEAKLAAHLAQGRSLDQASQSWGVSLSTVRTHLKHIFTKTDTSRQVDLVHKLLTGPAMLSTNKDDGTDDDE